MKLTAQKKLNSHSRLHRLKTPILALTGGIASGKSTVARVLREEGLVVIGADQLIKDIYAQKKTLRFLKKILPSCVEGGKINFKTLRVAAFERPALLRQLEKFLYAHLEKAFKARLKGVGRCPVIVYEVPLLFEKKLENKVDAILLVTAPKEVQIKRLIKRDGITRSLALKILREQIPVAQKKAKADVVLNNNGSLKQLERATLHLIKNYLALNFS